MENRSKTIISMKAVHKDEFYCIPHAVLDYGQEFPVNRISENFFYCFLKWNGQSVKICLVQEVSEKNMSLIQVLFIMNVSFLSWK